MEIETESAINADKNAALYRAERMALPAISVHEWSRLHGIARSTALAWARAGHIPAWRSGAAWLIRPTAQPPALATGAAAHKPRPQTQEAK